MCFFKDKKLAEDLAGDLVSQKQQMIYLLLYALGCGAFMTSSFGQAFWSGSPALGLYDYLFDISFFIVIFATIFYSYKLNGGKEGKDIVARYICLALPITIKSLIVVMPLILIGVILDTPDITGLDPEKDVLMNNEFEKIGKQLENNEITAKETFSLLNQTIDTHTDETEHPTGPYTFLGMLAGQAFVIWRYVVCFKIIGGKKA